MARITLSPLVSSLQGSVKSLTFKTGKQGSIACGRPLPRSSRSASQNTRRLKFSRGSQRWVEYPAWYRNKWDEWRQGTTSGRNSFIKYVLEESSSAYQNILYLPERLGNMLPGGWTCATGAGAGELNLSWNSKLHGSRYKIFYCYRQMNVYVYPTVPSSLRCDALSGIVTLPYSGAYTNLYMWGFDTETEKFTFGKTRFGVYTG